MSAIKLIRDPYLLYGKADGGQTFVREQRTERDVEIPPAFVITDETGAMWTFGPEYVETKGRFEFGVLRNDSPVGELAYKIVFRPTRGNVLGQVAIYGSGYGRKIWNGRTFV